MNLNRKVFILIFVLVSLITTSCVQNVNSTPKTSGDNWEKVGSESQGDLLDIRLFSDKPPYRYVGYRTEPLFVDDFPVLLSSMNYSQTYINKAMLCFKGLAWRLNDTGLSPNVKSAMNEGQYNVTLFIFVDTNGFIRQLLINKKSVGSFYTAAMYYDIDGNWYDITDQIR